MIVNYNGHIYPSGQRLIHPENRAFHYGDGLFESMRVFSGRLPLLSQHLERLYAGMLFLQMEIPPFFSPPFFQKEIEKITSAEGNHRIRLNVFRSGSGLYTPQQNTPAFLIETNPLTETEFNLPTEGISLGICESVQLPPNPQLQYKTANSIPYIQASIEQEQQTWDAGLLLNTKGQIAEASSANVFAWINGSLRTPPLSSGCLPGITRQLLLDIAQAENIPHLEINLSPIDLEIAEEVWLSNSIQGIRWGKEFRGKSAGQEKATFFIEKLNQVIA